MIRLRYHGVSPGEGALLRLLVNVSPKLPGTVKQERWKSRRRHFWWLIKGFVRAPHTALTHLLCNCTQQNGRPSHQIWLGVSFHPPSRHTLPSTTSLDYALKTPARQRTQCRSRSIRQYHPCPVYCEGLMWRSTSTNRFWICVRPLDYD